MESTSRDYHVCQMESLQQTACGMATDMYISCDLLSRSAGSSAKGCCQPLDRQHAAAAVAQMLRTAAAISQEHATAEALIREQQPDRQNGYEKDSSLMVQRCQEAYAELVVPHCRCAELLLFPRMLA